MGHPRQPPRLPSREISRSRDPMHRNRPYRLPERNARTQQSIQRRRRLHPQRRKAGTEQMASGDLWANSARIVRRSWNPSLSPSCRTYRSLRARGQPRRLSPHEDCRPSRSGVSSGIDCRRSHRIRASGAVAGFEFFAGAEGFNVDEAVDGQDAVEVVDFVLQEFREVAVVSGAEFVMLAVDSLIADGDFAIAFDLHED